MPGGLLPRASRAATNSAAPCAPTANRQRHDYRRWLPTQERPERERRGRDLATCGGFGHTSPFTHPLLALYPDIDNGSQYRCRVGLARQGVALGGGPDHP